MIKELISIMLAIIVVIVVVFDLVGWEHLHKHDGMMSREEGAVVALRLLNGVDYEPPPATGEVFADMTDKDYWGTKWAEAAYLAGLFVGCGERDGKPLFCPGGGE